MLSKKKMNTPKPVPTTSTSVIPPAPLPAPTPSITVESQCETKPLLGKEITPKLNNQIELRWKLATTTVLDKARLIAYYFGLMASDVQFVVEKNMGFC